MLATTISSPTASQQTPDEALGTYLRQLGTTPEQQLRIAAIYLASRRAKPATEPHLFILPWALPPDGNPIKVKGLVPGTVGEGYALLHCQLDIGRYRVVLTVVTDPMGPWVDVYPRVGERVSTTVDVFLQQGSLPPESPGSSAGRRNLRATPAMDRRHKRSMFRSRLRSRTDEQDPPSTR